MGSGDIGATKRVVIPVQGTSDEQRSQDWAVAIAVRLQVPIHAVHIAREIFPAKGTMFAHLEQKARDEGVRVHTKIERGRGVVEEILEELKDTDLVVIGTRKLASSYHVGSIAAAVIARAPCPVQVVRLD